MQQQISGEVAVLIYASPQILSEFNENRSIFVEIITKIKLTYTFFLRPGWTRIFLKNNLSAFVCYSVCLSYGLVPEIKALIDWLID